MMCDALWGSSVLRKEASGLCITYREGVDGLRQQRQQRELRGCGSRNKTASGSGRCDARMTTGSVLLGYNSLLPCGDLLPKKNRKGRKMRPFFFRGEGTDGVRPGTAIGIYKGGHIRKIREPTLVFPLGLRAGSK